jgi:hypothetical protein
MAMSDDLLASAWVRYESLADVFVACAVVRYSTCRRWHVLSGSVGLFRDLIIYELIGEGLCTMEGDRVAMQVSASLGNKDVSNTAGVTTEYLGFVGCPDCSMIASVRWGGCLGSTEGPVAQVRITCVNRHWFFMPATRSPSVSRITQGGIGVSAFADCRQR